MKTAIGLILTILAAMFTAERLTHTTDPPPEKLDYVPANGPWITLGEEKK